MTDEAPQYVIPTTVGRRNLKDEISHYVRNDVRAYYTRPLASLVGELSRRKP